MDKENFNRLLEEIPSISFNLNWCGRNGQLTVIDYVIDLNNYQVDISCELFEAGHFDSGDFFTAPTFTTDGIEIEDLEVGLFEIDGTSINLNPEQLELLKSIISNNIKSN
jgi:hypothetical protein